ncbi:MAG: M48 family metallopeptidase [Pseudomonadota bacterium]
MGAFGLQSHIWNNNLKSILLLIGFPFLLLVLFFGISILLVSANGYSGSVEQGLALALEGLPRTAAFAGLGAIVWFGIAWFANTSIVRASVGAKGLDRKSHPEIYNLLENLCISRGLNMPNLQIIETPALNAFASGIDEQSYTITLTRGLIDRLDRDELEAVIAHELTHIVNRDVRLLIISIIFVGIFSFVAELMFRGFFRSGIRMGGHTRSRQGDSRGGGILILIAFALIALAYILAIVIRFSLSRRREYLADAGAVELTRNPDAMISALQKISGRSEVSAPPDVQQMMIENTVRFAGVFATHPPIDQRIAALVEYAGGENGAIGAST